MITDTPLMVTAKRAGSLLKHRTLDLHSLVGTLDDEPLNVLVADDGSTVAYIKALIFDEEPKVSMKGKISALAAAGLCESSADLVIVGANCLSAGAYARRGFLLAPKWVRLFLPTSQEIYPRLYDFGRQTRKYFKWMLKKVKDEGFQCETINDPKWFDDFYYQMYRPYEIGRASCRERVLTSV
jgi:hypothetical protein